MFVNGSAIAISIHAPARGATAETQEILTFDIISIHAPARGATAVNNPASLQLGISIHAPARGATRPHQKEEADKPNFNPRSREGSDGQRNINGTNYDISIHAPARGATAFLCQVGASVWLFQSTLPRGERPTYFVSYVLDLYISIHAPARGATIFLFWTWTR